MDTILREERYIVFVNTQEHVFRIHELVSGPESWPNPFRLVLPASHSYKSRTFYGHSSADVAQEAAQYIGAAARPNLKARGSTA